MVQLLSAIEREAAKSGITPAEVGKAMSKGYVRGPGGVLHLINRIVSKNHGKVPQDIAVLAQSMGLNLGQDSLKSAANAGQSATAQGSGSGTNAATYGQLLRQEFQGKLSAPATGQANLPSTGTSSSANGSTWFKKDQEKTLPSSDGSSPPAPVTIDPSLAWNGNAGLGSQGQSQKKVW
jgi:hypothetical protein